MLQFSYESYFSHNPRIYRTCRPKRISKFINLFISLPKVQNRFDTFEQQTLLPYPRLLDSLPYCSFTEFMVDLCGIRGGNCSLISIEQARIEAAKTVEIHSM